MICLDPLLMEGGLETKPQLIVTHPEDSTMDAELGSGPYNADLASKRMD
jgi:hypothetical protein